MRLKIGILLLILNYILGWPALIGIEAVAAATKSEFLAVYVGPGVYVFSWIILGAAVVIGGPDSVALVKNWIARKRGRYLSRSKDDSAPPL